MTKPHTKPAALLRLMAGRKGDKITSRDVAALHLAAAMLDEQAQQLAKHFAAYGDALSELIDARTRADAMQAGIRGLLETHT